MACLAFVLGMVQKSPCVATSWADGEVRYAAMCYSDVPYLYTGRGFAELAVPYSRHRRPVPGDGVPGADRLLRVRRRAASPTRSAAGRTSTSAASCPADQVCAAARRDRGERRCTSWSRRSCSALCCWSRRGCWPACTGAGPGTRWLFAASPALVLTGLVNWDLLAVALRRRRAVGVVARPTGAERGDDRARHGRQALPAVPAGCAARGVPARRAGCGRPGSPPPRPSASWLVVNAPAMLLGPGAVDGVLDLQLRPRRGPRLAVAGAGSRPGTRVTPHLVNLVSSVVFAAVCLGCSCSAWPPAYAAGGAAGVPGGGRVPAGEQGVLAAVRAVAAAAGGAGPAPLARPADLAGRGGALLRRGVALPRRSHAPPPRAAAPDRSTASRSSCGCSGELYLVAVVVRDVPGDPSRDPVAGWEAARRRRRRARRSGDLDRGRTWWW